MPGGAGADFQVKKKDVRVSKVVFGNGKLHRGTRFFEIEILDQFQIDEREVLREGLTIGVT